MKLELENETKDDDALVGGLKKIAKHVVKRDEKNEERFEEIDEKVESGLSKLGDKLEKGLTLAADKLERIASKNSALSILGSDDPSSDLLEVMTDGEKSLIKVYEAHIANDSISDTGSKNSRDPIFRTAQGLFFAHAFKSHPSIDGRASLARAEKYFKAFEGGYGGITKAAFDTNDADVGGNTVPTAIENEMRRLITDNSIMRPDVTVIPMREKTIELPIEGTNALTVSIGTAAVAEGATIPDSIPATAVTDTVTVAAEPFKGRAVASVESLQDSAISIMEWIQAKLAEEFGRGEDIQALEGTGAPFTGLSDDAGVNEIVAGANGDPLTYPMLVGIVYNAGERATRRGAKWYMPPLGMKEAISLVDSQGMPVVQFGRVHEAIGPNILGYPVEVHSGILANRTKGTGVAMWNIYFGNPKGIVFADRTGMTWAVSADAGFDNDQVHMKLTKRTGIAVAVPTAFTRKLDVDEN